MGVVWPALWICLAGANTVLGAAAGSVVGWGGDYYGETDVPVTAQSGVVAVAAGETHSLALKTDGSVIAWGGGLTNLGIEPDFGQSIVPAAAQSGVTAIAAGVSHTVALKTNGSVVAWGRNSNGQTNVPAVAQSGVTAIAAGGFFTVALKSSGSVVGWGANFDGQITVPFAAKGGVIAIAAGYSHTVALKSDGSVVAWGNNQHGQTTVPDAAKSQVTAIAAAYAYTMALKSDGSVLVWGGDIYGITNVPAAAQSGVIAISAATTHAVALKSDGSVVGWGANSTGQSTEPKGLGKVAAVAAGGTHTLALVTPTAPNITQQPVSQSLHVGQNASLTVAASGYVLSYQWLRDGVEIPNATNTLLNLGPVQPGQAGNYTVVVGNILGSVTSTPPAVLTVNPALSGFVVAWGAGVYGESEVPAVAQGEVMAIAAGAFHSLALKTDGSVVAWGATNYGQTTVPVAARSGVTAIAGGYNHSVALKSDGSVVAWGLNDRGQSTVPLAAKSGVAAIAAGGDKTLALKTDGSVVAWGTGNAGYPTPIAALSGVMAVAAGEQHTVVLKADGSVIGWGYNKFGQADVPIAAQSGVTAIAAGGNYTVALKADGSVVGWGSVPVVPVAAQSGVSAIAAGLHSPVALKMDGTVVTWDAVSFNGADPSSYDDRPFEARSGVAAVAAGYSQTLALVVPTAPDIITQPLSQTVNEGRSVRFSVTATGHFLTYKWRKNGDDIPGATNATYELDAAAADQAGAYSVIVSNPLGSVTNAAPAILTVKAAIPAFSLVAWGADFYGQTDLPVAAQNGVIAIAAGGVVRAAGVTRHHGHSLALRTDGSVVAWGSNGYGQTDVPLAAQSGVSAIAAGEASSVALKADGSVVTWGAGTFDVRLYPSLANPESEMNYGQSIVPAAAQHGVASVAAGYYHTVAL